MKAAELMSAPVVTVRPDNTVVDAARQLVRHRIAALPVVDAHRHLVGMVGEADLFHARAATVWSDRTEERGSHATKPQIYVSDVMHSDVLWVRDDDELALCVELMKRHNGRSLPVLRRGALVGIVTRRDVLAALTRHRRHEADDQAARATAGTGAIDLAAHESLELSP